MSLQAETTVAALAYDEMRADAGVRAHYRAFHAWLESQSPESLAAKRAEADLTFHRVGITFAVYGDDQGTERLIPFDIIPRIIPAAEWSGLKIGLAQRVRARHRLVVDVLRAIGVPAEAAEADAEGIEHHVSETTLKAFARFLQSREEK